MENFLSLNDVEWAQIEPLFVKPIRRSRGKPHTPWRSVVNSVLLVLTTKIKWGAIPTDTPDFATKSAAHRWFVLWEKNGFLHQMLQKLETRNHITLPRRRQRKPKEAAITVTVQ
jgi:transposase